MHKIILRKPDNLGVGIFHENKDGTWDYYLLSETECGAYNGITSDYMIQIVCAAADIGAEVSIEKVSE